MSLARLGLPSSQGCVGEGVICWGFSCRYVPTLKRNMQVPAALLHSTYISSRGACLTPLSRALNPLLLSAAGFGSRSKERPPRQLPDKLKPLLEECRPLYELLRSRALRPLSALQLQEARDTEAGGLQQGGSEWHASVRLSTAQKGSAAALLIWSL